MRLSSLAFIAKSSFMPLLHIILISMCVSVKQGRNSRTCSATYETYALEILVWSRFLMKYPKHRMVRRQVSNLWTNILSSWVLVGS